MSWIPVEVVASCWKCENPWLELRKYPSTLPSASTIMAAVPQRMSTDEAMGSVGGWKQVRYCKGDGILEVPS